MKLKCKHCNNVWDYNGDKKVICICPDCRKQVYIENSLFQQSVEQDNDQ